MDQIEPQIMEICRSVLMNTPNYAQKNILNSFGCNDIVLSLGTTRIPA
jgi:hypothetical protein